MIKNEAALADSPARATALACLTAGVEAAAPARAVADAVHLDGDALSIAGTTYDLREFDEVLVLGGGKAAAGMARALEGVLGDRLDGGVVVATDLVSTDVVAVVDGDHPIPSERNVDGARRVLERAEAAGERTLVLVVVAGGGSALLAAPAEGVSLAALQSTTDALLDSGATIDEINAVRKHLSSIKGGGLARAAAPATVVGLVISDVVGNDLSVIASGPTAADESTYEDALGVLDRYGIEADASVRERLERGARGELPETPRAGDPAFERVHNHVVADGLTALEAAAETATERGYDALVLSSRVRGEAREIAKPLVAVAEESRASAHPAAPPLVFLSGGEATVTVRGDGEGGPNQEFALSAGVELAGEDDRAIAVAAADTDGRDGGTDAAGALVDSATVTDPDAARDALAENDAYSYLRGRDALVRTGSTGTNVNDLYVVVVEAGDD